MPDEIYLAARVDGCSPFGAFVRVMLPLAAPGLVATGLLVFIFAWNEFLFALTLHRDARPRARCRSAIALFPGLHEVPVGRDRGRLGPRHRPGRAARDRCSSAACIDGLTAGAVKG